MHTIALPRGSVSASPRSPKMACSAWSAFRTMTTAMCAPWPASAADRHGWPPSAPSTSSGSARVSKPRTVNSLRTRQRAMPEPIAPNPTNATVSAIPKSRHFGRSVEPVAGLLSGWGVERFQGGPDAFRKAGGDERSSWLVQRFFQDDQRETAGGDGIEDRGFIPYALGGQDGEDDELELDALAGQQRQARIVREHRARLGGHDRRDLELCADAAGCAAHVQLQRLRNGGLVRGHAGEERGKHQTGEAGGREQYGGLVFVGQADR